MKKFKKVYIEITNVCNLSCNFCPKTKRKHKFMDKKEFNYILNQVKPFTEHIYLHLMGEPLLNENIEYFLEESFKSGIHVNLTTNGTLLKKFGDKLIKAKALRQVNISLHSFEANKKTVELEEYLKDVSNFIVNAREKSDIICAIRLWNMDSNELKGENNLNKEILKILEENLKLDFSLSEKLQETNRIKLKENKNWIELVNQNENIPFAIDKGELVRAFIIPSEAETQIVIMAHHLAGDGKSIIYFVKDIMNALSGIPLTYKPLALLERNLPQKGLPAIAKLYARYCKHKWNNRFFTWQDYYHLHEKYWKSVSSDIRCETLSVEETQRIKDAARHIGCSVNSYIVTLYY